MPIELPAPDSRNVLDDLRRIVHVLRRSSRSAEKRLGVTGAQLFVLKTLCEAPAMSLNELATLTHTHQSTVSVVVRRLAGRKLVRRTVSREDGRRIELRATARGRELLAQEPAAAQEELIRAIDSLPTAKRRALAVGLRELTTRMRLVDDNAPTMFFEDEHPHVPKALRRAR